MKKINWDRKRGETLDQWEARLRAAARQSESVHTQSVLGFYLTAIHSQRREEERQATGTPKAEKFLIDKVEKVVATKVEKIVPRSAGEKGPLKRK